MANFFVERRSLETVLNQCRYATPDYQREYSWKQGEVGELWEDLMECYVDDASKKYDDYLLGTLVGAKNSSGTYDIVDGQQRLVTLTLLFCAIRKVIKKYNKKMKDGEVNELIDKINTYIRVDDTGLIKIDSGSNATLKKIQLETTDPTLNNIPSRRLKTNFRILCKEVEKLCQKCGLDDTDEQKFKTGVRTLRSVIEDLCKRTLFIFVDIQNDNYTHQIFQTLNSKGMDLTQADLIKSHLLKNIIEGENELNIAWNGIMESVKNQDSLLYDSRLSRSSEKDVQKIKLYQTIKDTYTRQDDICRYIEELKIDAKYIKYLENPGTVPDKVPSIIKHSFYSIKQLNAIYIRRPIIAACRKWGIDNERKTAPVIDCLLKFFFVYRTICGKDIDLLKKISRTVTSKILNDEDEENPDKLNHIYWSILKRKVGEEYVDNIDASEFKEGFKEQAYDFKDGELKYVLTSLELKCRGDPVNTIGKCELEHIFPRNPEQDDWPNKKELNKHVSRLGNITLMAGKWNRELSNHKFDIKRGNDNDEKSCYCKSELKINEKYLKSYEKWDLEEIISREDHLRELALKVWSLEEYFKNAKEPKSQ